MIDFHHARHYQAVQLRTQAANISRELERQHRYGTVRKIDAGAAEARFLIDCGIRSDILSHIGDMNLQLEVAVFQASHGNCIIKITRCLAIDRDDRQIPEVSPFL